jgi:hypothetical protein
MLDDANPLEGWCLSEILKTDAGPATNDVFGKLFCYLQSVFRAFYRRIASSNVEFQLFNVDAKELPSYLKAQHFARIEVAIFRFTRRFTLLTRS